MNRGRKASVWLREHPPTPASSRHPAGVPILGDRIRPCQGPATAQLGLGQRLCQAMVGSGPFSQGGNTFDRWRSLLSWCKPLVWMSTPGGAAQNLSILSLLPARPGFQLDSRLQPPLDRGFSMSAGSAFPLWFFLSSRGACARSEIQRHGPSRDVSFSF